MPTAQTNRSTPPECLHCGGTAFAETEGDVIQEFRGETLTVTMPVLRCTHCGWQTLPPGHLDELRVRVADAYRRKHGLLTSRDIRDRREQLGMSQRRFAEFLGVGAASIPRWESWQVQEKLYDEKIRQATAAAMPGGGCITTLFLTQYWGRAPRATFPTASSCNYQAWIPAQDILRCEAEMLPGLEAADAEMREARHVRQWTLATADNSPPAEPASGPRNRIPNPDEAFCPPA
ncbi:MAG TPA: type II TA system antitoxin MqsA family protein [Opitutaceae bacterium]|nr:type II TA system antitoxin MqsA family protein [Opitutaceae bacterium]